MGKRKTEEVPLSSIEEINKGLEGDSDTKFEDEFEDEFEDDEDNLEEWVSDVHDIFDDFEYHTD